MSLLVTLFLVLVNIFNFVSANAPKVTKTEVTPNYCSLHIIVFCQREMNNRFHHSLSIILVGRGPDRGGDLGGVLHHPRVRGPRRVRPHPQDHPGPQEAGVKRQEAGEGGVHERVGKGRQEGNTLLLPSCLQTDGWHGDNSLNFRRSGEDFSSVGGKQTDKA